jgi:hypothetical protein
MNVALFLEIKNEYSEHLTDILTPYIYEGLTSIYQKAVQISQETNSPKKILIIFQKLLQAVPTWNQSQIENETNRIKQCSNTAEYFDDLVKAVVKSNIILLTYTNSISNVIAQSFYNNFSTSTFIHRCYTESAKDAHNNPYLFYNEVNNLDFKRNQIVVQQNIKAAIPRAVRKILPISMILKEFLVNSINIINEPIEAKPFSGNKEIIEAIKTESGKTDKDKIKTIMNIDKIISHSKENTLLDPYQDRVDFSPKPHKSFSDIHKIVGGKPNFPDMNKKVNSSHEKKEIPRLEMKQDLDKKVKMPMKLFQREDFSKKEHIKHHEEKPPSDGDPQSHDDPLNKHLSHTSKKLVDLQLDERSDMAETVTGTTISSAKNLELTSKKNITGSKDYIEKYGMTTEENDTKVKKK